MFSDIVTDVSTYHYFFLIQLHLSLIQYTRFYN